MDLKYFSKNGKILPIGEAAIPLSNIEYQYGFGVYENIRVNDGIPYFLDDHVERLLESARIIGIAHSFSEASVRKSVTDLVKKNGAGTPARPNDGHSGRYNLKVLLIGGKEPALYIVCLNPLFPDKKLYTEGADFVTYEYERPFPHAKTLNMLQSYLAYKEAYEADCYDALLINGKGCITEGTRTNFFCIQGRTLVSAPESEILLGVTRKAVLKMAKENGYTLEERELRFSDVIHSDGAFVTSTSSKIIPVRSIDKHAITVASNTLRELMELFDEFLQNCKGKLIPLEAGSDASRAQ
ncbi:aminotransferase class IV family protein [Candidatus Kaiserbacteria bacterium]|nr:aminotransferase class IV family protein [Candidatus Kaiserbacteria bacterium]